MMTSDELQKHIEKKIAIAMAGVNHRGVTSSDGCEVDVKYDYNPETDKFTELYRIATPQFRKHSNNFNTETSNEPRGIRSTH